MTELNDRIAQFNAVMAIYGDDRTRIYKRNNGSIALTINRPQIQELAVPNGVEIIERYEHSINYWTDLERLYIPKSVKVIGEWAFGRFINLKEITGAENVNIIGRSAFNRCASLTRVKMDSVIKIEDNAFASCLSLKQVEFNSATTLESAAFWGCNKLEEFKGGAVKTVGKSAFRECKLLNNVTFKPTKIEEWAFLSTGISSIDLKNARYIGPRAFANSNLSGFHTLNCEFLGNGAFDETMATVSNNGRPVLIRYR